MNLKLKATLLWMLGWVVSTLVVFMIFVVCWLMLAYPAILFSIALGGCVLYVLIGAWFSIYHHLKSKEENNGNI